MVVPNSPNLAPILANFEVRTKCLAFLCIRKRNFEGQLKTGEYQICLIFFLEKSATLLSNPKSHDLQSDLSYFH